MLEAMEAKKRLEGRVQGRAERERELVIEMIKDGASESKILKYAKITAERLQIIKDSMEA
jgi:hypothetical protein